MIHCIVHPIVLSSSRVECGHLGWTYSDVCMYVRKYIVDIELG